MKLMSKSSVCQYPLLTKFVLCPAPQTELILLTVGACAGDGGGNSGGGGSGGGGSVCMPVLVEARRG